MTTPGQQQIEVDLLMLQQSKDTIAGNTNNRLQSGIANARGQIHRGVPVGEGSPGRDPEYGFGVINLVAALTADVPVVTGAPTKASTAAGAEPSTPDGSRGPGWLLVLILAAAAIALVVAVIGFVVWGRERRRSGVP